jgi:AraC-like DNA-binding protein
MRMQTTARSRARRHRRRLPSATGGITRLACRRLDEAGIAIDPLLKKAGLSTTQISDPRARLPVTAQIRFLTLAAEVLGDDLLGFHLAKVPDFRELGLYYYVVASSDVLRDVFERGAKYTAILNEGVVQSCVEGRHCGIRMKYAGVSRHSDRHQIEFWMAAILRLCRHLTGRQLVPVRVTFAHKRQSIPPEMAEFFGTQIEYGTNTDEIAFGVERGTLPLVSADPYLNKMLIAYCEEALAERKKQTGSLQADVENAVVPLLPHGKAKAHEIARQLHMSRRTFARRLAAERLTFSGVLHGLRADLAKRYLADADLSVSQIAWLLGYKEVGAFSHAFRRWTGKTPREVRDGA